MKDKILAKIKAKHPTLVIPKKILDAAAAKVEAKCGGDETLIDAQLEVYEDFNPIPDQVKLFDKLSTAEAKAKENSNPKKDKDPKEGDEPGEPAKDKNAADPMAAFTAQMAAMQKELAELRTEKGQTVIKSKISEAMKAKSIPELIWAKRVLPQKEEDIEAFVTEVDTDYSAFNQSLTDQGLLSTGAARRSAAPASGDKTPPPKAEVDAIVKTIM